MHTSFGTPLLLGFLLTLARVTGLFAFVPIPGIRSGLDAARMLFALVVTIALLPVWPSTVTTIPGFVRLTGWIAAEAAFGITIGLAVSALLETFQIAAQMIGLQAGYSYAGTIDLNSQADSSVMLVVAQLLGASLFFALGLDREVVRALVLSLQAVPADSFLITHSIVGKLVHLSAGIFATGLRLAMPEIALLLLIDLCFSVMGRLQPQIQFISMAFPVKMLAALVLLSLSLPAFPAITENAARPMLEVLLQICGGRK